MRIMTDRISPDEPAYGYFCGPKMQPGYTETQNPRMVEQIWVVRGDALACFERDFGPASEWPYVPPLLMPSDGENPVGLMQWHGEKHRNDPQWGQLIKEYKESSTLFEDALRKDEQQHEVIYNRSNIGPYQTTQRNGYDRERNWRNYMNEKARRTGKRII